MWCKGTKTGDLYRIKKEIFNTKLKTVCLEEKRRHKKSMSSRLKRHNKEKNLKNRIRRSLSN